MKPSEFNDRQTDMFSRPPKPSEARKARDRAMESVASHTSDAVRAKAVDVVRSLCGSRETFISDDVWPHFSDEERLLFDGRMLGAVLVRAAKDGWCVKAGYAPSTRRHMSPVVVWKSLLVR